MFRKLRVAAILFPAALLLTAGCKSNTSAPEQSSQPAPATPNQSTAGPVSAPPAASNPATSAAPPAGSPAANVATAPPPPPPIVVPAGTILRVRLVQTLGSNISQEGQRFDATLSAPVVVHRDRVIPAGAAAVGTVTEAHPAGRFKGGATLGVQLTGLRIAGQFYPVRTSVVAEATKGKGKRTATMVGGGTGAGAIIGGIAGGGKGALIGGLIGAGAGTAGAATGNRDIVLRSESPLSFRLTSALTLPPIAANAPPQNEPGRQPLPPPTNP